MKYLYIILWFFYTSVSASTVAPWVVCNGLPGCKSDMTGYVQPSIKNNDFFAFLWSAIAEGIKYVAVLAVLALVISGIMYMISVGEDDKTAKAKKMIIWSLIGVLISTSAWMIINMVNSFKIN